MLELGISLLLTLFVYLSFPLIYVGWKGRIYKKKAAKLALWNSVIGCILFCIIRVIVSDGEVFFTSFAPATLYFFINKWILTDKLAIDDTNEKTKTIGNKLINNLQNTILILLCSIILFAIVYPISINKKCENMLPSLPSEVSWVKLSEVYKNNDVYFVKNGLMNSIYVIEGDSIKAYTYNDKNRFSASGKTEYAHSATLLDMQNYFGSHFHYGAPKPKDIITYALPVGIIIPCIILITILILCYVIHKSAEEALFNLVKKEPLLIELKAKFKDEAITKTQYSKSLKDYFSKQVMKNNFFMSIFKILY